MKPADLAALRWFLALRHGTSSTQLAEHMGRSQRTARRLLNVWAAEGLAVPPAKVRDRWEPAVRLVTR